MSPDFVYGLTMDAEGSAEDVENGENFSIQNAKRRSPTELRYGCDKIWNQVLPYFLKEVRLLLLNLIRYI